MTHAPLARAKTAWSPYDRVGSWPHGYESELMPHKGGAGARARREVEELLDEPDADEHDDHVDHVRAQAPAEEHALDGLCERLHERGREPILPAGFQERGLEVLAGDLAPPRRRGACLTGRVEVAHQFVSDARALGVSERVAGEDAAHSRVEPRARFGRHLHGVILLPTVVQSRWRIPSIPSRARTGAPGRER